MPETTNNPIIQTDFLVLGSGIAGLTFAMEMADHARVIVITKKDEFESNTNYAQGGIAAVLDPNDTFEAHVRDTLRAGGGLCKEHVVDAVVRQGPGMIHKLMDWGTRFYFDENRQQYDLGKEGGHSHRRVIHAQDLTGREVERALLNALKTKPNVELREHEIGFEILTWEKDGRTRCRGVRTLNKPNTQVRTYEAGAVLLCTGGLGRVYLHTTNPVIATGDGVAMAFRARIPIVNMEFIQFHPTSFYTATEETFLISEAVRGEGAILRLRDGSTFMEKYHEMGCLAPRDVVAQAIDREMKRSGAPNVLLDCTHLDAEFLKHRFPTIGKQCLEQGVDFTRQPIPVVPAAHYACGGVMTNMQGETTLPGLFATGEVSYTGIHGANRLASNSLLEALVYSHWAAEHIQSHREDYRIEPDRPPLPMQTIHSIDERFEKVRISYTTDELRRLMWNYVGIVRSTERLTWAKERASVIRREVEQLVNTGFVSPALIELWNLAEVADLIITSALQRKESRGLHYNIDYPETDDQFWKHDTILKK